MTGISVRACMCQCSQKFISLQIATMFSEIEIYCFRNLHHQIRVAFSLLFFEEIYRVLSKHMCRYEYFVYVVSVCIIQVKLNNTGKHKPSWIYSTYHAIIELFV